MSTINLINKSNFLPTPPSDTGFGSDVESYYWFQQKGQTGRGNVCPTPGALEVDRKLNRERHIFQPAEKLINTSNLNKC